MSFKELRNLSKNLSLLYVEDDPLLREKTALIFKNLFSHVDVAEDGQYGLDLYNQQHQKHAKYYDIVVSDIQMPRLDGIALSKEIFKLNKNQKIIIVSAYNDKEYLIELINIGVEAFMQKPLASENMLEVLINVCGSFAEVKEDDEIVTLSENSLYNLSKSVLLINDVKVELSENELKLLHLLVKNKNRSFNAIEIFNHLYFDDPEKEFSADSIKSLVKRLRKKVPQNLISNTQQLGYSINF